LVKKLIQTKGETFNAMVRLENVLFTPTSNKIIGREKG